MSNCFCGGWFWREEGEYCCCCCCAIIIVILSLSLIANKGVNVFWKESLHVRFTSLFWRDYSNWRRTLLREKVTRGLCNYKNFALGTLNQKGKKKMWRKMSTFSLLHFFLWKDTRHATHALCFITSEKMFSVTQTVTQSVRLNATVSKRDVTRRYEEVLLLVFSVCVGSIIRECILFFFISSFRHTSFFPINANAFGRARAKENDFFIPLNYKHHSPWKLLLFPPFVEKRE